MRRLLVVLFVSLLAIAAFSGNHSTATTPTPSPRSEGSEARISVPSSASPEASAPEASEAEVHEYIGQMRVVQAMIATVAPILSEEGIRTREIYEVVGSVNTIFWIDAYMSGVDPPAQFAEQHERVARMISAMAIGAQVFKDGLVSSDEGAMLVGAIAVQEAAKSVDLEMRALFDLLGVAPSDPLEPIDYGTEEGEGSDGSSGSSAQPVSETFAGTGDDVVRVSLDSGIATITASHAGSGNFIVILYGPQGQEELVVNEIGPYQGTRAIPIEAAGQHTIDIQADGPWTLAVEQ